MNFWWYPTNEQLERRHISVSKMLLFQCCSHFVLFQCMRQIRRFKIYYITSRTINHCMRNLSCLIRNLFPKKFFHKKLVSFYQLSNIIKTIANNKTLFRCLSVFISLSFSLRFLDLYQAWKLDNMLNKFTN